MPSKKKQHRTISVYSTYSFRDKDPVIDELRTLAQDTARARGVAFEKVYNDAALDANMSQSTPRNWFKGSVRRPQNPTVEAFGRALGYYRKWTVMKKGG